MVGKTGQKSSKYAKLPNRFTPDFLRFMDGRTNAARRIKNRLKQLIGDLGGPDSLFYNDLTRCQRLVFVEARAAEMEAEITAGDKASMSAYVQLTNTLLGLVRDLDQLRPKRMADDSVEYDWSRLTIAELDEMERLCKKATDPAAARYVLGDDTAADIEARRSVRNPERSGPPLLEGPAIAGLLTHDQEKDEDRARLFE